MTLMKTLDFIHRFHRLHRFGFGVGFHPQISQITQKPNQGSDRSVESVKSVDRKK
jgi:hypothetical protein